MANRTDALGNQVVIGKYYGYSTDSSGVTTTNIGKVIKETKTGYTLELVSCRRAYSTGEPEDYPVAGTKVTVKALKLFPMNTSDLEYTLKFALEVIEQNGLENTKNTDNWVVGEALEEAINNSKLNSVEI